MFNNHVKMYYSTSEEIYFKKKNRKRLHILTFFIIYTNSVVFEFIQIQTLSTKNDPKQ